MGPSTLASRFLLAALPPLLFALPAAAQAPAAPQTEAPADFIADARLMYRVVACAGTDPLPANLDAKIVEAYCVRQTKAQTKYRDTYLPQAAPFLANLRPQGLPTTIVYPFGGGDLLSALTTYPDGRDITTMSLEHAGDPRRLAKITKAEQLRVSLDLIRATSSGLLYANDSMTENLMKGQRGEIPGQLAFFITALAVHGYEPVSLKFFRIQPDGSPHYLTLSEIAASEKATAKVLRAPHMWTAPDFSPAFSNSELTFVKKGEDPKTQARVHRHIAADLSDGALATAPGPIQYLKTKTPVAAMTKAASYLLWRDDFNQVRDYLTGNMVLMISDSTGIPPAYATKAGFVQETYGNFEKSFLGTSETHNAAFRELWKKQPRRALPFRYGYIDGAGLFHLVVTKKAP
ncbi:hypothetical protein P2318_21570 [Myxococcaceae bacterium GXIMD 01537]